MSSSNIIKAESLETQNSSLYNNVTDVYICIFFDGTGNNMYEQLNKGEHLRNLTDKAVKENPPQVDFSASPYLFTSEVDTMYMEYEAKQMQEKAEYGMNRYHEQRIQAEEDYKIKNIRGSSSSTDINDNGGLKYSNVAILRSITKQYKNNHGQLDCGNNKIGINYNLYIEGAGKLWDEGQDVVGLGMGTGPTGVVALVSKAIVFIGNYLHSHIELGMRKSVNIHFAVFGFSRGSTCGRVFSYIAARGKNGEHLIREKEFEQYMPINKSYYNNGRVCLFDAFEHTTVDFLGIYDTVSAIGFIAKDDNCANHGVNQLVAHKVDGKTWYVNRLHNLPKFVWGDAKKNYHRRNAQEYGLWSHKLEKVKHTFHICAMDEFRENFALVDLGLSLPEGCTEVFMPGCHSDIGGGIMKDEQFARITLRTFIDFNEDKKNKKLPTKIVTNSDPRVFPEEESCQPMLKAPREENDSLLESGMMSAGWLQSTAEKNELKEGKVVTLNGIAWGVVTTAELVSNKIVTGPPNVDSILTDYRMAKMGIKMGNAITESKIAQIQQGMEGVDVYYQKLKDKIEFKRFAMEGYSNITLEMMYERALSGKVGLRSQGWPEEFLPFGGQPSGKGGQEKLPERFRITQTHKGSLGYYKTRLLKKYKSDSEKYREFLTPEIADYKELRKNYLHFSCTDELNPLQVIDDGYVNKKVGGTVGANLGNPPNWKKRNNDFLLCRIIYRGDNSDDNLHYMNEYPR